MNYRSDWSKPWNNREARSPRSNADSEQHPCVHAPTMARQNAHRRATVAPGATVPYAQLSTSRNAASNISRLRNSGSTARLFGPGQVLEGANRRRDSAIKVPTSVAKPAVLTKILLTLVSIVPALL